MYGEGGNVWDVEKMKCGEKMEGKDGCMYGMYGMENREVEGRV